MMAASPTISSISSLRWREPPEMAAWAKTNSLTATCTEDVFQGSKCVVHGATHAAARTFVFD